MRFFSIVLFFSVYAFSGVVLRTEDGGNSWQREHSGTLFSLNAVSVDPLSGFAVAVGNRGTVLRRSAEGAWENVSPGGIPGNLRSVAVGSDGVCMACGDSGVLISSFDRGSTWREWQDFQCGGTDLLSVNFDPNSSGSFVITGEEGYIFTSSDRVAYTGTEFPFIGSCVQLCGSSPEIAVSSAGEIYSILRQSLQALRERLFLNGVTAVSSGGAPFAAVGDNGTVCVYRDGEWIERESACEEDLYAAAHIIYGTNLCAVGEKGTILLSTDCGNSWSVVFSGVSGNLKGIAGNGSGTGYIVGDSFLGRFLP